MKPLLIAHRGDTVNFPENTLEAFESAFQKEADGIELDLMFNQGKLIVVHNYGYDKNKKYPELQEILEKFSKKGKIQIEVKCMGLGFLPSLKSLLNSYLNADLEVTSSVFPLIPYLREAFPRLPIGVIFHPFYFEPWMKENFKTKKIVSYTKLFKADNIHLGSWDQTTREMVNACHKAGFKFSSHLPKISFPEQMQRYGKMIDWEIDQCTFDDINFLKYKNG